MQTYTHLPIAIPKLFKNIVSEVATNLNRNVTFKHGTWLHLMKLCADDKSSVASVKNNLYPLVMLIHEFEEKRANGILTTSLDFVIVTPTDPTLSFEDRYTPNVLPILYPIYAEFMAVVKNSNYFIGNIEREFNHTKIDALNIGTNDANGNVAYKLPDYLDGLIIKSLELTINEQQCTTDLNNNFN